MKAEPKTRRGPKPNPDRGTATGFRISNRDRFELQVAQAFVGARSLQEILAFAVADYLSGMCEVPGYNEALSAAEANQRKLAGIRSIGTKGRHADEGP